MRFKMRLLFEEEMKKKLDRVQYCPEFKKLKEICNRHGIGLDVVIDSSMHIDMSNEGGINFCATYDPSLGHRWLISVAEIAQRGFLDCRRTIQRVVCPGTHRREICAGGNDRGVLQGNKDGRYVCGSHEKRVAEKEQEKKLAPIDIIEAIDTIEANANLHPRLQPHG